MKFFLKIIGLFLVVTVNAQSDKPFVPYDEVSILINEIIIKVRQNNKWGICEMKTGKQITSIKYNSIYVFDANFSLLKAEIDGKFGLVTFSGKEITPFIYDNLFYRYEDLKMIRVECNNKHGLLDYKGKELIPLKYDGLAIFSDDTFYAKKDKKNFLLDTTGKEISNKYDEMFRLIDGLALVKINTREELIRGKFGFVNSKGKEIVPLKYDYADSFSEGLARVELNGKMGFIDTKGKEVISLKYDWVYDFVEGFAIVKSNKKVGFIDTTGKEVIPMIYDSVDSFSEGLAAVKLNDKLGFVNSTGEVVIPFIYTSIQFSRFENGIVYVRDEAENWFYINTKGEKIE